MRDQLTDEMLTQAAKQVAESMKASLPVPKECHHEFPPEFERDMKRLAAQTERRRHMRRYLQRVAAACLAVVISLSTWLAVDAEARAAFVQWVKTNNAAAVVQSVPLDIRTVDVKSLISSNIDNFIDCHIMHPFFCICCLLDLQVFSGGKDCNSSLII